VKCEDVRAWLVRDLDGFAEPSAEAVAHLERCPACAAEAERLQRLADAAREALPAADVPSGFADRVMASVAGPLGDEALERASRTRPRWMLLALVVVLAPVAALAFFPRSGVDVRGTRLVEREGAWVAAASGDEFALETGWFVDAGPVRVTALAPSRLRGGAALSLLAGSVALESRAPAVVETRLGAIRLLGNTRCLAILAGEEDLEMVGLDGIRGSMRAALAVAVLAGGATVANAQGAEPAREREAVVARPDEAPRLMEEIAKRLHEIEDRLARLEQEGARWPTPVATPAPPPPPAVPGQRAVLRGRVVGADGEEVGLKRRDSGMEEMLERARRGDEHAREHLRAVAEEIRRAVNGEPPSAPKPRHAVTANEYRLAMQGLANASATGAAQVREAALQALRGVELSQEDRAKFDKALSDALAAIEARRRELSAVEMQRMMVGQRLDALEAEVAEANAQLDAASLLATTRPEMELRGELTRRAPDKLLDRIAQLEDHLAEAKRLGDEGAVEAARGALAGLYRVRSARLRVAELRAALEAAERAGEERKADEVRRMLKLEEEELARQEK